MTNRNDLMRMIREANEAGGGRPLAQAVAALEEFDRRRVALAAQDRELDLGARIAAQRLTPFAAHEHHTAATDWLAEYTPERELDFRTAMVAEASTWYSHLPREVKADREELAEQARGRARTLASAYAQRTAAEREFLTVVGYLHARQGASGLPQIDQTVDPNNQPSPTPYPTQVFPTFGPDQDPFNQVEGFDHDSQASSQGAPLIQQVMQQNGGGSGYGSGPERPDSHTTAFDTADSYAEVPLGPPGQIPTAPVATDSMGSSHPNPVAGIPQDAGADRRQVAAAFIHGYSLPDPFGYRWGMTTEVMHPFHERCGSAHWPEESCRDTSHTASVAVGYLMNIEAARRAAQCEGIGVREGLRAIASSASPRDLGTAHNRFAAAWGNSDRTMEDTAVLHGFMAVVRPVLAEVGGKDDEGGLETEAGLVGDITNAIGGGARDAAALGMMPMMAARTCTACKSGDCSDCTNPDCGCAKHPRGHSRMGAGGLSSGGVTQEERDNAAHSYHGTGRFPVDSAADVRNAERDVGRSSLPHDSLVHYINDMAHEYHVKPIDE